MWLSAASVPQHKSTSIQHNWPVAFTPARRSVVEMKYVRMPRACRDVKMWREKEWQWNSWCMSKKQTGRLAIAVFRSWSDEVLFVSAAQLHGHARQPVGQFTGTTGRQSAQTAGGNMSSYWVHAQGYRPTAAFLSYTASKCAAAKISCFALEKQFVLLCALM